MSGASAKSQVEGFHVLQRLLDEGRIAQDQYRRALREAEKTEERVEETLLRLGAISEQELLKRLAEVYRTQFVSTEKLARANIEPMLLELVPLRLAERLGVFPVLLKRRTQVLSVVAADLEAHDIAKQVLMVADVRKVNVLVARPAAVEALIQKHYEKQPRAFAALIRAKRSEAAPMNDLSGGFGGHRPDSIAVGGFDAGGVPGGYDAMSIPLGSMESGLDPFDSLGAGPSTPPPAEMSSAPEAAQPPPSFTISAPDIMEQLAVMPSVASMTAPKAPSQPQTVFRTPTEAPPAQDAPKQAQGPGSDAYLETLHVMTALLEQDRGELRTHTADVARLTRKICERMGLMGKEVYEVMVAAYLHDVGKASTYHLTALNVARYEGHRTQAQKNYRTPSRLFDTAMIPEGSKLALEHLYERFDGNGFPDRLIGKDIPLGARILAVVETYADLTSHDRNPYRTMLTAAQACEAVKSFEDQIFDPTVCDLLRLVVLGDVRSKLLAERRTVLLVDPDPEETTILDMRFASAGFEVVVARDALEAAAKLSGVDVVITEVDLPGKDGFEFSEMVLKRTQKMPVLFLTRRGDRMSINRGFELGAADYLVKPASPDVVVAKASQLFERAASGTGGRGVTGSLREMSLPDVVQILSNGRKNGLLVIESGGSRGEVHFGEGAVWDARFGPHKGEEAFYKMLMLTDGEFHLDPSFQPQRRVIQQSTEGLLLEGMRRLDEGAR